MIRADRRVLVFSAHAADFCSRAGGTIARFVDAGAQVQIYDMTYGEKCESPGAYAHGQQPGHEEVKARRRREIQAAARVLGAQADCFDFGDCPLVIDDARRFRVLDAVRAFAPDLVLTHWHNDFLHPDHAETSRAVLWACRYCNAPGRRTEHAPCARPEIMYFECVLGAAPACGFVPQVYVDVSGVFERKLEALRQLASQPQLPRGYEKLARYRGLEASTTAGMACEFAEGFVRVGTEAVGQ